MGYIEQVNNYLIAMDCYAAPAMGGGEGNHTTGRSFVMARQGSTEALLRNVKRGQARVKLN